MSWGLPRHIPILLAIDCEPDPRMPPPGSNLPWAGLAATLAEVEDWRQAMVARWRHPVTVNWFWRLDPQIETLHGRDDWGLVAHGAMIEATARAGDPHGLHPHATRWDAACQAWCNDHGNWPWIERLTRRAVAGYRDYFGRPPESFRFGDCWLSAELLALEESLGLRHDLTLTADQPPQPSLNGREWSTGALPDRRGAPFLPFRRDPDRFLRAAPGRREGLWLFPSVSGAPQLPPGGYGRRAWLRSRLRGQAWPRPPLDLEQRVANLGGPPERFKPVFENGLAKAGFRYALVALRSDAAGQRPTGLRNVRQNLKLLLNHQWSPRFRLVSPGGALDLLGLS